MGIDAHFELHSESSINGGKEVAGHTKATSNHTPLSPPLCQLSQDGRRGATRKVADVGITGDAYLCSAYYCTFVGY